MYPNTHHSKIEFPEDIPPTSCQKFESRVPSGQPPCLSFLSFPPTSVLLHLSPSLRLRLYLPFLFVHLKSPFRHFSPSNGPPSSPSYHAFVLLFSNTACLCVSSSEGVEHKLSAHLGLKAKGYWPRPPTHGAHQDRRDFPFVRLCACLCVAGHHVCLSACNRVCVHR